LAIVMPVSSAGSELPRLERELDDARALG